MATTSLKLGHGGRCLGGVSPKAYNKAVEQLSKELVGRAPAQIRQSSQAKALLREIDNVTAGTGAYAAKYANIRAYNRGVMAQIKLVDRALARFSSKAAAARIAAERAGRAGAHSSRAGSASIQGMGLTLGIAIDAAFMAYYMHQLKELDKNDATEAAELGVSVDTLRNARCELLFHLAAEKAWDALSEDEREQAVGAVVHMAPSGAGFLHVPMAPKVEIATSEEHLQELRDKWITPSFKGMEFLPGDDLETE